MDCRDNDRVTKSPDVKPDGHSPAPVPGRQRAKLTGQDDVPDGVAYVRRVVWLCGVWITLLMAGGSPAVASPPGSHDATAGQVLMTDTAGSRKQQQVAFLHQLRQADPRYQTINRAVFNARNELGVVLDRRVEMDAIRPLLQTILTQMARTFPEQDLTVVAYAPTRPPREIGTARLQVRTGEMTYTPAVPH